MSARQRRVIIFGAGDIGRQALDHIGKENVAFFVDNSSQCHGKVIEGRLVLSWDEYLQLEREYEIVVAIRKCRDVDKQLKEKSIIYTHFLPEWQPVWGYVLDRLRLKLCNNLGNKILLLGANSAPDVTLMILDQLRFAKKDCCIFILADTKQEKVGINTHEIVTSEFSGEFDTDEIIVTDPWHSRELEAKARSYYQGRARITNPFFQLRHDESSELISNQYVGDAFPGRSNETDWQRDFYKYNDVEGVGRLADVLYRYRPLFRHVEIETVNRCNGACSFCPVSAGHDIRERKEMSDELFHKIIGELSDLNFDGRVALFSNNEPFFDPKIIERQKYAYEHLSKAKMHLFTNGTLLTLDKFKAIIPYLDELIIDNYNQDLKLNPTSKDIVIYCAGHPELEEKVSVVLRKPDEILTSRGGDAPNRTDKRKFSNEKCVLPFEQMIIRPDGKVSLCCNDPYGKVTLGDLNKQTLREVWYGEEFQSIRDKLIKGRGFLPHCQYCDTFYFSTGT